VTKPSAGDDISGAQSIAEQFVNDEVDLIFAAGSIPGALAAKAAIQGTDIPVVKVSSHAASKR
jgi:ABC-type uncharacterized transport system substrate-binding protein